MPFIFIQLGTRTKGVKSSMKIMLHKSSTLRDTQLSQLARKPRIFLIEISYRRTRKMARPEEALPVKFRSAPCSGLLPTLKIQANSFLPVFISCCVSAPLSGG